MLFLIRLLKGFIFTAYKGTFKPSLLKVINTATTAKCMIIGNGPSLNDEWDSIYSRSKNEDIFVTNSFVLSEHFFKIKPQFYILYDPAFWDDNVDAKIRATEMGILEEIRAKTTWGMNVVTSYNGEKILRQFFKDNKNIHIYSNNGFILNNYNKLSHNLYNRFLATPIIQNVMVGAIFIAIGIGYKEISLFGAEHSWTKEIRVNHQNEVCLLDSHFFDTEKDIVSLKPWKRSYGGVYKMHEVLLDLSKMFQAYFLIKQYGSNKGVKIINYTRNSFIDAFDRDNIN